MKNIKTQLLIVIALLLALNWSMPPQIGAYGGSDIVKVSTLPTACVPEKSPVYLLSAAPYGLYRCSATDTITQVGMGPLSGANGSSLQLKSNRTTVAGSAAATITATGAIPTDSLVVGVTIRVTSTFSNTSLTSFTAGDGTTADLFGSGVALTSGTVTDYSDHKSTFTPKIYGAGANVVLTGTGANFAANGVAEVIVFYYVLNSPTS